MILDGNKIKKSKESEFIQELKRLSIQKKLLLIENNDKASAAYTVQKKRIFEKASIPICQEMLPDDYTEKSCISLIEKYAGDDAVFGIFVQMPLKKDIKPAHVLGKIPVKKDIEGVTTGILGNIYMGDEFIVPPTAMAIVYILEYYGISIEGKHAVIINRSAVIGKPLIALLLNRNATVTVCHSKTNNIDQHLESADIVITGVGHPHFISKQKIRKNACIVDASINYENGKLVGDVDFNNYDSTHKITPVPGGVGPVTNLMLLRNIINILKKTV